jgi:undecaprenyl-diphosphatase
VRKRLVPLVPLGGLAVVAAAAWVRRVVVPARPDDVPTARPRRIPDPDARPSPDGAGVRLAVNPDSGPMWRENPVADLRDALPAADIHELHPHDDLVAVLCEGLADDSGIVAIGAAGGDGTLSAAASVALEHDRVLVAVPSGTFNHLARDLGLDAPDDAIAAVRAGTVVHMDLGLVEGGDERRTFVNTLSFGGYTTIVDARERLQPRLGKFLALAVALARELPGMEPLEMEIDGRRELVWVGWIGNGRYAPEGFAPSWRERLDDGLLDVRLVLGDRRWARVRLVADVLAGRLQRCPVYREDRVEAVTISTSDGPLRLAVDGETFDGAASFSVTKLRRALSVAVPPGEETAGTPWPAGGHSTGVDGRSGGTVARRAT